VVLGFVLLKLLLVEFMDLYPRFIDRQIGEPRVDPPAGVEIADAFLLDIQRMMRMSAEDPLRIVMLRVCDRSRRNFRRHPKPPRIEAVDHSRNRLAFEVHLLKLQIQRRPKSAEPQVVHLESIKLMAVNRHMPQSAVHPAICLIHTHAHQMGHDVRQSVVMVSFHPHHFNAAFRIRELADESQEFPVFFFQAGKIEVGKNVAQQDQPLKPAVLQDQRGLAGMTRLRPQVQIREDQRVADRQIHTSVLAADCYGVINVASILVQKVTSR